MNSFGTFLRYVRKQRDLTQEQVADRLNIVTPVLSKWENDRAVPSLDMLCKLCNVLNVSIEECRSSELTDGERLLPPENYDPIKLGETIKDLRIKNDWSQAGVGKRLFVTSQTVSKWESGGISSLEILAKLAELFGLTPTELLNGLERVRVLPERQPAADRRKKSNEFILKITAAILAVVVLAGAITGLIIGIISDSYKQIENRFVPPLKEYISVEEAGYDALKDYYYFNCLFYETDGEPLVFAVADGRIKYIDMQGLTIEHSDGLLSVYHNVTAEVEEGQEVKCGQQIGKVIDYGCFILTMSNDEGAVTPSEYIDYKESQT